MGAYEDCLEHSTQAMARGDTPSVTSCLIVIERRTRERGKNRVEAYGSDQSGSAIDRSFFPCSRLFLSDTKFSRVCKMSAKMFVLFISLIVCFIICMF